MEEHQHMKSMVYSVAAIFALICSTMAQQAPDSGPQDSNPLSLQLRAQAEPNGTVLLTWRGDPTSPGFTIYRSIGPGHYSPLVTVGPNVQEYTYCCIGGGVLYFRVCDRLDPQTCSNEVRVRLPPETTSRSREKEPHHSLKSPLCSCVSITLPSESKT